MVTSLAQGWYRDPFELHQDRYFSAGEPTKLVRDGDRESYDPSPNRPVPEGDLIAAEPVGGDTQDGSDQRRADDASSEPYDPAKATRAALDVFDRSTNW